MISANRTYPTALRNLLLLVSAVMLLLALSVSGASGQVVNGGDDNSGDNGDNGEEHPEAEHLDHGLPDFDIRFDPEPEPRGQPTGSQQEIIDALGEDGITVRWDDLFGSPTMIISYGDFITDDDSRCNRLNGNGLGCPPEAAQAIALDFVSQYPELFPTPDGISIVPVHVYDTTFQPDGLVMTTHVSLEQRADGVRLFGSRLNLTMDAGGGILNLGARYDANGAPPTSDTNVDEEDAVFLAAGYAGVNELEGIDLVRISDPEGPIHQFENPFMPALEGFDPHPIFVEHVVFPMPFGMTNRHAWYVEIQVDYDEVYEIVIDASSEELLFRRNQVHAEAPEGTVFTGQNPCVDGIVDPCDLLDPVVVSFDGWVDPAPNETTAGNNAIVVHNPAGDDTDEGGPTAANHHFNYDYTDAIRTSGEAGLDVDIQTDMEFVVTQAFYYVNMLHERYYALGFDEVAGNFQQDNFGNGGVEGDPVLVYVNWGFDAGLCCNASMWTPADGTSPVLRLRVGLGPNNLFMHRAMNGDTVTHEWAHGLSRRLVGGGSMGSGAQTGGMGEGWSDAVANSLWNDPVYGQYNNGNMDTGIRGVSYDNNTFTYADLCSWSGGCQVHRDGRIWATTLWDMRTLLQDEWGADPGTTRHEQLLVDGMKNTPTSPSFLDARDGILAADVARYGGENQCLIWSAFAGRGMGESAASVSNGSNVTEAFDAPGECSPSADANGPYETDEGTPVTLNGSGSEPGTHASAGAIVSWDWDFTNDGQFDDASGESPSFDLVGQDGVFTVTLRVTDSLGLTDTDSTTVTVNNVLPSVTIDPAGPVDEGSPLTVTGVISDPGWEDELTGTIDWGFGNTEPIVGDLDNDPPEATLTFSMTHTYGDTSQSGDPPSGTFTVEVCGTDDHGTTCDSIEVVVDNVPPEVEIDKTDAINVHGVDAIMNQIGEPVDFTGYATDPGSDDLHLTWDWDDETTSTATYLVNPPNPDPFPSPDINPRDITDEQTHTFGDACYYLVTFSATDDDGGVSEPDEIAVIIVGDADRSRSQGYWSHQYRLQGRTDFDEATLLCYLEITGFMSQVFHGEVDASTIDLAFDVLNPRGHQGDMRVLLDVQLLAAWLNFANGAIGYDELVDTTGNGISDTPFAEAVETAENIRLDPSATRAALEAQKDILERINLRDGG